MNLNFRVLASVALFAFASPAFASGTGAELEQQIYSSAGVASPGFNTGANPAGYAYNVTTKLALLGGYSTGAMPAGTQPYSLRPEVIFASRFITGGVYYVYPTNALALNLAGMPWKSVALGLGITTTTANLTGGLGFTPGVIFNPTGKFRVGAVATTSLSAISLLGLGIAGDVAKWLRLTLDATSGTAFNNVTLIPGVTVGGMAWRLSAAYSYRLGGAVAGLGGLELGAGVAIGNSFFLQARTSGFSSYVLGLAFKLTK